MKFLLIYNLLFCNSVIDSNFYSILLAKNSTFFICLNVNSKGYYNGEAIVASNSLVQFFYDKKTMNPESSRKHILSILKFRLKIDIDSIDFNLYGFNKIINNQNIINKSKKGRRKFVEHYFKSITDKRRLQIQKIVVSDEDRTSIIKVLFNWKIPTFIDDETGLLMLYGFPNIRG